MKEARKQAETRVRYVCYLPLAELCCGCETCLPRLSQSDPPHSGLTSEEPSTWYGALALTLKSLQQRESIIESWALVISKIGAYVMEIQRQEVHTGPSSSPGTGGGSFFLGWAYLSSTKRLIRVSMHCYFFLGLGLAITLWRVIDYQMY